MSDYTPRGWLRGLVTYLQPECRLCHNHNERKRYVRNKLKHGWLADRYTKGQRARIVRVHGIAELRRRDAAWKTRGGQREVLWWEALDTDERVAAMRSGLMTLLDCAAWASRYPDEVPLLNGEFEYIAATLE